MKMRCCGTMWSVLYSVLVLGVCTGLAKRNRKLTLPGVVGVMLLKMACFKPIRLARRGTPSFIRKGNAVCRTRLVGGRAPGRTHRPAGADIVDSSNCFDFVNSSLSPVVLFRLRLSSVGDVFQGIRSDGFLTARSQALMLRWSAVCRQGPTVPVQTLEPWKDWLPPDLHGFCTWVVCIWCVLYVF